MNKFNDKCDETLATLTEDQVDLNEGLDASMLELIDILKHCKKVLVEMQPLQHAGVSDCLEKIDRAIENYRTSGTGKMERLVPVRNVGTFTQRMETYP